MTTRWYLYRFWSNCAFSASKSVMNWFDLLRIYRIENLVAPRNLRRSTHHSLTWRKLASFPLPCIIIFPAFSCYFLLPNFDYNGCKFYCFIFSANESAKNTTQGNWSSTHGEKNMQSQTKIFVLCKNHLFENSSRYQASNAYLSSKGPLSLQQYETKIVILQSR